MEDTGCHERLGYTQATMLNFYNDPKRILDIFENFRLSKKCKQNMCMEIYCFIY